MEALEALTAISICLGFFATVVLSLYFYYRARHQERMSMIEKGFEFPKKNHANGTSLRSLKFGLFLISIGVGLFFGYLVARTTSINDVIAYFCLILLFGGIGLILNYYLENKINGSAA